MSDGGSSSNSSSTVAFVILLCFYVRLFELAVVEVYVSGTHSIHLPQSAVASTKDPQFFSADAKCSADHGPLLRTSPLVTCVNCYTVNK